MRNLVKLFALCALVPVAASAATFNAYNDFSTSQNPNGPWSYAGGSVIAPVLLGYSGSNFGPGFGFDYWAASPNDLPAVGKNGAPAGTVNVPANELWMHPGPNAGSDSLVLFTVQTTGSYYLTDYFTHRDIANSGNGQTVSTYLNGVLLDSAGLSTVYGNTHAFQSVDHLQLVAGDVIAFGVNNKGDYSYDSTGFNATIASTPEPSSIALLGTGLLGVAGAIRRRLKA